MRLARLALNKPDRHASGAVAREAERADAIAPLKGDGRTMRAIRQLQRADSAVHRQRRGSQQPEREIGQIDDVGTTEIADRITTPETVASLPSRFRSMIAVTTTGMVKITLANNNVTWCAEAAAMVSAKALHNASILDSRAHS